ncbi:MAG: hypothetical protein H0T75_10090, partial [Rhizobiales bacterium]|nr:hypothetical protein [Hyphomicrobiales bacterium]
LPMADPQQSPPRVTSLFAAIRNRHGHPEVASYFRVLANWPEFLEAAWASIDPIIATAAYDARKRELLDMSVELASGLSRPRGAVTAEDVRSSVSAATRADLSAILAGFRSGLDPDLLLDVTLIRTMLLGDSGEAARSPFSAVRR